MKRFASLFLLPLAALGDSGAAERQCDACNSVVDALMQLDLSARGQAPAREHCAALADGSVQRDCASLFATHGSRLGDLLVSVPSQACAHTGECALDGIDDADTLLSDNVNAAADAHATTATADPMAAEEAAVAARASLMAGNAAASSAGTAALDLTASPNANRPGFAVADAASGDNEDDEDDNDDEEEDDDNDDDGDDEDSTAKELRDMFGARAGDSAVVRAAKAIEADMLVQDRLAVTAADSDPVLAPGADDVLIGDRADTGELPSDLLFASATDPVTAAAEEANQRKQEALRENDALNNDDDGEDEDDNTADAVDDISGPADPATADEVDASDEAAGRAAQQIAEDGDVLAADQDGDEDEDEDDEVDEDDVANYAEQLASTLEAKADDAEQQAALSTADTVEGDNDDEEADEEEDNDNEQADNDDNDDDDEDLLVEEQTPEAVLMRDPTADILVADEDSASPAPALFANMEAYHATRNERELLAKPTDKFLKDVIEDVVSSVDA